MLGLSNPFKSAPKAPPAPTESDLLRDLIQRVKDVEAEAASLRLEWAETLDKVKAWAGRQAQRDRREAMRALEAPESHDQEPGDHQEPPVIGLRPKDQLRARVLGKRA